MDMFQRVSDVAFQFHICFANGPAAVLNTFFIQGCRGPLPDYALHRKGLPRWGDQFQGDHEIWVLPGLVNIEKAIENGHLW